MKAIRIHEFGPTEEVLRYEDVPTPEPAADEILIKVEAAALNRADLGLRKGTYRVSPDQLPIIPGREFAGPIAKHLGAKVVATTGREEKARRLRKLGADVTIDVSETDFVLEVTRVTGNRGVDVVLEMVGGEVYEKSLEVLAPGGRLFSIGGAFGPIPDPPPVLTERRRATRFSITNHLKARPQDL